MQGVKANSDTWVVPLIMAYYWFLRIFVKYLFKINGYTKI